MSLDATFSRAMEGFALPKAAPLAVAVSGGADSMALVLMAQRWAWMRGHPVHAFTVDHGLRPEAPDEAAQVHGWLEAYGLPHTTLVWQEVKPRTGLPEAAREARYRLLFEACRAHGIGHLLTAHHRDDQAETVLLRLVSGSGIEGLAGIAPCSGREGMTLLRPLLDVSKTALAEYLSEWGQPWLEDPSNATTAYTRNRLRLMLRASPASRDRLHTLGARFAAVRNGLQQRTAAALRDSAMCFAEGYALLDEDVLRNHAPEIRIRALRALVTTLSGHGYPPRTAPLRHALACVEARSPATLHGCLLRPLERKRDRRILICREAAAMQKPLPLAAMRTVHWDGRFACHVRYPPGDANALPPLRFGALGQEGIKYLKTKGWNNPDRLPAAVTVTLPAIWGIDEPLIVPHLLYNRRKYEAKIAFCPRIPLADGEDYADFRHLAYSGHHT